MMDRRSSPEQNVSTILFRYNTANCPENLHNRKPRVHPLGMFCEFKVLRLYALSRVQFRDINYRPKWWSGCTVAIRVVIDIHSFPYPHIYCPCYWYFLFPYAVHRRSIQCGAPVPPHRYQRSWVLWSRPVLPSRRHYRTEPGEGIHSSGMAHTLPVLAPGFRLGLLCPKREGGYPGSLKLNIWNFVLNVILETITMTS